MAVGVLWEFFEWSMDYFFGKDMQKDTIVHSFHSVMLDDTKSNIPVAVDNIHEVIIDGYKLPFDGYLDIGLFDTMKDLAVAALGAAIFCIFLVAYLKTKGQNKVAAMFIPNTKGFFNGLRAEHEKRRSSNEQNVIDSDDSSDENNSSENKKE